ncbi:hypothetical protein AMTR_s00080p00182800 [Amborella trichopoda]|uniref:Aminotransferase-like plant mobile domain-containing protein n=1 Tax=Amborella trichopoda TaxID=13333 RepID=W1PBJ0_AMBTC|nr:hypothetical protein AMTR_s00080p00182800 [Amborella trichopoda]
MPTIQQNTDNELPSEEYMVWYNLVFHPLIHNVTNSPKDILQPHIHEEEEMVHAHEPQYITRPRGYEDQLDSAVKASTVMLAEALTLRQIDMGDVEARMDHLQRQYNDETVPDEAGDDEVGQSSRAVEDLAPSIEPAVEDPEDITHEINSISLREGDACNGTF